MKDPNQSSHFNQYLAWSIAGLIYSLSFFIRVSPNTLQAILQQDLSLDFQELGYVSASFYYSYAFFQIVGTLLSFRFSFLKVFWSYLIIFLWGLLIFTGAQSYESALWGRILMGMGCSLDFAFCLFLARTFFPRKNFAVFVGLTNFFGVIGGAIAQYPLEHLLSYFGWRDIFEALLILFLACSVGLYLSLSLTDVERQKSPSVGVLARELWSKKGTFILILWLCFTMVLPILMIPEMWGSLFVETLYGVTSIEASVILSYFFIGIGIGNLTLGVFRQLFGVLTIIRWALALEGVACLIFIYGADIFGTIMLPCLALLIGMTASALLLFFDVLNSIFDDGRLAISSLNIFMTLLSASSHPLVGWYLDSSLFQGLPLAGALVESFSVLPLLLLVSTILAVTARVPLLSEEPKES